MNIDDAGLRGKRPDLLALVQAASRLLEEQLGQSAPLVRVEWDVLKDSRGRDLVLLNLSDWMGTVGYRFAPDELSNPDHMKVKMHRLWGDLLMVQSHVQLDRMNWQLNYAGDN